MKNRFLKYFLKGLVVLLSLLVVLYTFVFIYVSANKKKIIRQVTEEIGKKLNGNVSIEDVELSFFSHFPSVSVELHNVKITDSLYATHHHAFFNGEKVYVNVAVFNMIRKHSFISGFSVEKGAFYLFTDTSGYTNKYLFHPRSDDSANAGGGKGRNQLKKIELKNVRLVDDDRKKNKLHDLLVKNLDIGMEDRVEAGFLFMAEADIRVNSLAFNLQRGSFLKGKRITGDFAMKYDKTRKQLQFDSVDVKVDGQRFNVTARFDMAGDDRQFSMRIHSRGIGYAFAKGLLTEKISTALSIADVDKPLDVSAGISGPLKGGDPFITIDFSAANTHLVTPFVDFDEASFKGFYTNEVVAGLPRKDPNSKILIREFSAKWQGLPVTSSHIEIMNLLVPQLSCDLHSKFTLPAFNDIIGSNAIQLGSGEGSADISYKGPIQKNSNSNSFVNGSIYFKNGTVLYRPRDVELRNVNGRVVFKSSDVFVENLQCEVLGNKVVMDGRALNLLTLVDAEPNKVNLDWNIYSPSLNLDAFTFLLKARKKAVTAERPKTKLVKMASSIDRVLDEGSLQVNLKTPRLVYKKFIAGNVLANVSLLQDRYIINKVSMQHAGGQMDLSGSIISESAGRHMAKVKVALQNVDVSRTLEAFNNFGQDGITSAVIAGKLSADADASLAIDDEGKAYPGSLEGMVDFSLKEGALINYEPVKKLQMFLFKNRDFDHIRFAELKDRFEIKNQEVKINRMQIQSSVMTMFVEGIFSNKGTTDISIQVPLSNIHNRESEFNPDNVNTGKKAGSSIFLRGRPGPDGNIKFKLDLFNKFKRDKEKETGM